MKVLYITMDPIEVNTSANIRNRGLIKGLYKIGCEVSTCSLESDKNSINYDDSFFEVSRHIKYRFAIKQNKLYSVLRTKKQPKGQGRNEKESKMLSSRYISQVIHLLKSLIRKMARLSVYDMQKINVRNVDSLHIDLLDFDLMISSSDPPSAHLIAERIVKKNSCRIPWIQYWGDPMLGDVANPIGKWKIKRVFREENRILDLCDAVVYTSPFTLETQKTLYKKSAEKMSYCVQAISETSGMTYEIKNLAQKEKKIKLGYFGNYPSKYRNIKPLFDAVKTAKTYMLVCGAGDVPIESDYIEQKGRVNEKELEIYRREISITVCLCNDKGTQIPGKIYYEAANGKPIIVIVDGCHKGDMKRFFEKFGRYIICENESEQILDAIKLATEDVRNGKIYRVPMEMLPETVASTVLKSVN